ncbi:MAG: DUF1566 domain-containing protein [Spirochaetales bacterium]|nr:DUF1566 domain-containing protein [Spirochaetales bacterium]
MKKVIFTLIVTGLLLSLTACPEAPKNPIASGYLDTYNLNLRDTGPAGGLIFYINPNADTDGWKYMEAAPGDQSTSMRWHNGSFMTTGAMATVIGTGKDNTAAIVLKQGDGSYAAKLCDDLTIAGYSDWFLPSEDELNEIYENLKLKGVGGFVDYNYWSSSEKNTFHACKKQFGHGVITGYNKGLKFYVRAVRSF